MGLGLLQDLKKCGGEGGGSRGVKKEVDVKLLGLKLTDD